MSGQEARQTSHHHAGSDTASKKGVFASFLPASPCTARHSKADLKGLRLSCLVSRRLLRVHIVAARSHKPRLSTTHIPPAPLSPIEYDPDLYELNRCRRRSAGLV